MTASSLLPAPNLMPLMRYRDLAEAMGWLEQAFAFEKQIAVSDADGDVIYGQMLYRGGLIMLGAVRDTDLDKLMRQPDEVGGVETQSCYVVVGDADAHYARAQEAGAEIVLELKSDGLGRRGYSCRDPEGHIWNFGTYNPGRGLAVAVAQPEADSPAPAPPAPRRTSPRLLMCLAVLLAALGATCWLYSDAMRDDLLTRIANAAESHSAGKAERAYAELVKVRAEKRASDERAAAAEAKARELDAERARGLALESGPGGMTEKLEHEQRERQAAEAALATLREELARKQSALDAAIEAKRVSDEKLAVKSAEAEAVPAPDTTEARQLPTASDGDTSQIETSATASAAEDLKEGGAVAAGGNAQTPIPDGQRQTLAAEGKSLRKRKGPAVKAWERKYPTYVLDMRHTWPYNSWSQ